MFIVKIADLKIAIDNKYSYVEKQCADYIVNCLEYDFIASATEEEINAEAILCNNEFDLGVLESLCIYRNIAKQLPCYNAFVMHCAAIEYNGSAICFSAKSGTGKTTHIKLWRKVFGNKVNIINGDKPILRLNGAEFTVYGTPWCGKENFNRNASAPLKAICFLERGEINDISVAEPHKSLNRLLKQIYIPDNDIDTSIALIDKLINTASMWDLKCTISEAAAKIAEAAIFLED